jgi:DNA-binding GntR family transcriptional regulator
MASREEHCQDCVRELGEPFEFVHDWLDELFPLLGPKHRSARHHVDGVEQVRQRWGDRAAQAAEIHIRKDFYGEVPTMEQVQIWTVLGVL